MNTGKNGYVKFFVFAKIRVLYKRKTCVRVFNDYADTDKTSRTLLENWEGFQHILKEQSGKKRYFAVFKHPIAIIKRKENLRM